MLTKYAIITQAQYDAVDAPTPATRETFSLPEKDARKFGMTSVGSVWRLWRTSPTSVDLTDRSMIGRWPDEAQVVEWTAMASAARRAWEAEDALQAEAKVDRLKDALESIWKAYFDAVGNERTQLLALVVEMITRRTPLSVTPITLSPAPARGRSKTSKNSQPLNL